MPLAHRELARDKRGATSHPVVDGLKDIVLGLAVQEPQILEFYLNLPTDGMLWCVDEKTGIQALFRRAPTKRLQKALWTAFDQFCASNCQGVRLLLFDGGRRPATLAV